MLGIALVLIDHFAACLPFYLQTEGLGSICGSFCILVDHNHVCCIKTSFSGLGNVNNE